MVFPSIPPTSSLDSNCRSKVAGQAVRQIVLLCAVCVHACAESDGVLAGGVVPGNTFLSGPDLMTDGLFLLVVLHDDLANGLLEVERTPLHLGVKLAVDEDTGVEILLGVDAEVLVLGHDSLVHVADDIEGLIASVFVAVDLVAHHTLLGTERSESLHEEEVGTERRLAIFQA